MADDLVVALELVEEALRDFSKKDKAKVLGALWILWDLDAAEKGDAED